MIDATDYEQFLLMLTDNINATRQISAPILKEKFKQWRLDTLDLIDREHNHNCKLTEIRPTIENTPIVFGKRMSTIRAWVMPGESEFIWINAAANPEWDKQYAIRSLLHEALHLTKDENGHYQLGPDMFYSPTPLGTLFGRNIHYSPEIDAAIFDHIKQFTTDPLWDKPVELGRGFNREVFANYK